MPRHTLRVLAVAAAALLAGYGCTDLATPTSAVPADVSLQKLTRPPGAHFNASGRARAASEVIGPAGGVLNLGSGNRLVFPAGAVSVPTTIQMRDHASYLGVELEPHGLRFPAGREPVLTLNHAGVDVSRYTALNVVYIADNGDILEVLPTQATGTVLSVRLQHFSGYIISGN